MTMRKSFADDTSGGLPYRSDRKSIARRSVAAGRNDFGIQDDLEHGDFDHQVDAQVIAGQMLERPSSRADHGADGRPRRSLNESRDAPPAPRRPSDRLRSGRPDSRQQPMRPNPNSFGDQRGGDDPFAWPGGDQKGMRSSFGQQPPSGDGFGGDMSRQSQFQNQFGGQNRPRPDGYGGRGGDVSNSRNGPRREDFPRREEEENVPTVDEDIKIEADSPKNNTKRCAAKLAVDDREAQEVAEDHGLVEAQDDDRASNRGGRVSVSMTTRRVSKASAATNKTSHASTDEADPKELRRAMAHEARAALHSSQARRPSEAIRASIPKNSTGANQSGDCSREAVKWFNSLDDDEKRKIRKSFGAVAHPKKMSFTAANRAAPKLSAKEWFRSLGPEQKIAIKQSHTGESDGPRSSAQQSGYGGRASEAARDSQSNEYGGRPTEAERPPNATESAEASRKQFESNPQEQQQQHTSFKKDTTEHDENDTFDTNVDLGYSSVKTKQSTRGSFMIKADSGKHGSLFDGATSKRRQSQRMTSLSEAGKLKLLEEQSRDLFIMRPASQQKLLISGMGIYSTKRSSTTQTGDDDREVGVNTEPPETADISTQAPPLVFRADPKEHSTAKTSTSIKEIGKSAEGNDKDQEHRDKNGEDANLLPFLRRVGPLIHAVMNENCPQPLRMQDLPTVEGDIAFGANFKLSGMDGEKMGRPDPSPPVQEIIMCPNLNGAAYACCMSTWEQDDPHFGDRCGQILGLVSLYEVCPNDSVTAPSRVLYSFSRFRSLCCVTSRPYFLVAGTADGELILFDLRSKGGKCPWLSKHLPGGSDANIAWIPPAFSTAEKVFKQGEMLTAEEVGLSVQHSWAILSLACSTDSSGKQSSIFALDEAGMISFWRVSDDNLQGAALQVMWSVDVNNSAKNSMSGSFGVIASSVAIPPQQDSTFVILSDIGVLQGKRLPPRRDDGPSGPQLLETRIGWDQRQHQFPVLCAFNTFVPNLLLISYSNGDLALFNTLLSVPLTTWPASYEMVSSVQWSPVRPAVFLISTPSCLEIWDLSEDTEIPADAYSAASLFTLAKIEGRYLGAAAFSPDGHVLVAVDDTTVFIRLPARYLKPLTELPSDVPQVRPMEDVLMPTVLPTEQSDAYPFPTMTAAQRNLDISKEYHLEIEVLNRVTVSIPWPIPDHPTDEKWAALAQLKSRPAHGLAIH